MNVQILADNSYLSGNQLEARNIYAAPMEKTSALPLTSTGEENLSNFGLDRRSSRRFRCAGESTIYCMSTAARTTGRIADLSLSGCLIRPEREDLFSEQQRVEVTFNVHRLFFRVQGYIRNVRSDEAIGVEFVALSERTRRQLTELIEELTERVAKISNSARWKQAS